jgi:hypothetical protein
MARELLKPLSHNKEDDRDRLTRWRGDRNNEAKTNAHQ